VDSRKRVKAVNPTSPCCGTFLERSSNVAVAAVAVKGGRPQAAAAAVRSTTRVRPPAREAPVT
jgi:hypothetical protein